MLVLGDTWLHMLLAEVPPAVVIIITMCWYGLITHWGFQIYYLVKRQRRISEKYQSYRRSQILFVRLQTQQNKKTDEMRILQDKYRRVRQDWVKKVKETAYYDENIIHVAPRGITSSPVNGALEPLIIKKPWFLKKLSRNKVVLRDYAAARPSQLMVSALLKNIIFSVIEKERLAQHWYNQARQEARIMNLKPVLEQIVKFSGIQVNKNYLTAACRRIFPVTSSVKTSPGGYIYILSNEKFYGPGVYKIGMTPTAEPGELIKNLEHNSNPFPYKVELMSYSRTATARLTAAPYELFEYLITPDEPANNFYQIELIKLKNWLLTGDSPEK